MKQFPLYKKQKLCSRIAVEHLFAEVEFSRLAYPLRMVARRNGGRHSDSPIAFLITVPKKRFRHAVDRVAMRRRIREAFRLNHQQYPLPDGTRLDVAFICVANKLEPYTSVERAMNKLLAAVTKHFAEVATADALEATAVHTEPEATAVHASEATAVHAEPGANEAEIPSDNTTADV
ncbi:MAG: ribonuclease P protein component [Muribaculaceae bacterium]|nr:ribonuclease P protein component [Muribaculaceae bacterium]